MMTAAADRRSFLTMLAAVPLSACVSDAAIKQVGAKAMYGLIGKMRAATGRRDELAGILTQGLGAMPGNLSYIVALDTKDTDGIWVTEVWSDVAAHAASLALPAVQDAIRRARPLIAGMERIAETMPLGGYGLAN